VHTGGGLERWPEGETPTGGDLQLCWPPTRGDLLAGETPSRRGAAGRRDAEPARESAGRRGRRRPEGRAAAGGEPAALEAERGAPEGAMGFAAGSLGPGVGDSGSRGG